ncbi:MAG: cyclic nucleotide-binding domain-containing protein [Deltaproteobacteria bacterium]|nr:cyclic nucleotide-binding domain-containing protein [Deltaproteobacteria bacterium]
MATSAPLSMPGFEGFEGVELLQKLPLFKTLTFDETRRLFAVARTEKRAKGDVVIQENELGGALYIVKSGSLRVLADGKEVNRVGAGELLGEMSLVDELLTSARVEVVEDAELLVLPRREFEALMTSDLALQVKVYRAFCRTLSERLRRANQAAIR